MLLSSPIVMGAESPRTTVWYQTLALRPSVTLPRTTAPGAMNAVGWISGSAGLGHELHQDPPLDRLSALLRGIVPVLQGERARERREIGVV